MIASSRVCIPNCLPTWMAEGIWKVLFSRIRLATAGVTTMISSAAHRPLLSTRLKRVCATTSLRLVDNALRICPCSSCGNTSMIRSTVLAALVVCNVAKTRCPVSAASIASRIVSRSRISPTRMMSGSSRRAPLKAAEKDRVCVPTSRWFTRQPWLWCTNSIGSSMVMMWSLRCLLAWSTIAASVVDLPLPVGPVTRTSPLCSNAARFRRGGSPSSSAVFTLVGICRNTAPQPYFWLKKLHRKRATPGISYPKSTSPVSSYCLILSSGAIS